MALAVGLALGLAVAVFVWWTARAQAANLVAAERGLLDTEKALLEERRSAAEQRAAALEASRSDTVTRLDECRDQLQAEMGARAAAEARLPRIAELEQVQRDRDARIQALQAELSAQRERNSDLAARAEEERRTAAEKLALLEDARTSLREAFLSLSSEALKSNNQAFLALAKENLEKFQEAARGDMTQRQQAIDELVKPMRESLEKVNLQIQAVEKERVSAYSGITEQVKSLLTSQDKLNRETGRLVTALRAPQVRGRWGEIQLRRVVELAGMLKHCDFVEQQSTESETGKLRPDMVVSLPGGKTIVIDAKVSLDAYMKAMETESEDERAVHFKAHAQQVRAQIVRLAQKSYWEQFTSAPEFAVLFLPGEPFFSAALEQDPMLIEYGVDQRVILATPTTLIALLKAVSYGWQQESLAENAEEIRRVGKELYERIAKLAEHFTGLGKALDKATHAYNDAVGTLESRVLPGARKFRELSVPSKVEIAALAENTQVTRELQAPEFRDAGESE
jgi:DNA recombination protein RmuC